MLFLIRSQKKPNNKNNNTRNVRRTENNNIKTDINSDGYILNVIAMHLIYLSLLRVCLKCSPTKVNIQCSPDF